MAALQRIERHVEHGQAIGHEERIELGTLQRLREALQMRKVEIRIGKGAGMDAAGPHEGAKSQLT